MGYGHSVVGVDNVEEVCDGVFVDVLILICFDTFVV